MALNTTSSALHLNLPTTGTTNQGRAPTLTTVHPSILASILDHHSRRQPTQPRAIGALLGTRSDNGHVEITSSFALPHVETEEQVAVDMDYYRSMNELAEKVSGSRETVVGWYSSTEGITAYSALIQNFFVQECGAANPAVHLTVDAEPKEVEQGQGLGVKAYISTQVGLTPKPENCVFLPIPCSLKYHLTERAGIDLLLPSTENSAALPPLASLASSLTTLSSQLSQVQEYVQTITSGSSAGKADSEIGRYLLDAVGRWKQEASKASAEDAGDDEEAGEGEGVKKDLQEILSISYLSALLRTQVELAARLNLLT